MKVCTEVEIFSQFVSAVSVVSTPIGGGDTPNLTAIIEFIFKMVGRYNLALVFYDFLVT